MLPAGNDYATLRSAFRWQVPARFSLARACAAERALREPDAPAVVEAVSGRVWTYAGLWEEACRLANALRALGVEEGDRVAILLPQRGEVPATHLAVWALGGVSLPLAPLFGPDAIAFRLADADVKAIVTDAAGLEKLPAAWDGIAISIDGAGEEARDYAELLSKAAPSVDPVETGPDVPAIMVYTSGTTGPPKGALHGHRVLLGHLPGVQFSHDLLPQPGDRLWTPADWAWAGGLFNVLLPGLYFGIPVVAGPQGRFEPEAAADLMQRQSIRNAFLPPTALKMMRGLDRATLRAKARLRSLASGGEPLGREALAWGHEAFGLQINEFYGQTECNYVLASCGAFGVGKAGAIGVAVPGHDVAVIDPKSGRACADEEEGEMAVRAPDPVIFLRYWNREEATREKFVDGPDGARWLVTGDRAAMDADGYVTFVGREDDVITSAGYRIGPGEIEDCLIAHPAVKLAAVVGQPDPLRTQAIVAYVQLNGDRTPDETLKTELAGHVRARLSAHEYPREVHFVDEVPLTTTGKVIRRGFREAPKA